MIRVLGSCASVVFQGLALLALLGLGRVRQRCVIHPNFSAVLLQTRVERAGAATFVSLLELQSRHA